MRPAAPTGSLLVTRIGQLVTNRPGLGSGPLGVLSGVDLVIEGGEVAWIGAAGTAPATDTMLDAAGRCVVPGFVDSHTHLVFAGDRVEEFAARMAGERYKAGGILSTVAATRSASASAPTAVATRLARDDRRGGHFSRRARRGA